jgi:hypothetical protein
MTRPDRVMHQETEPASRSEWGLRMNRSKETVDWERAQLLAAKTARWAVTMTKVRIRRCIAKTRWQLVTFLGAAGGESVGIVDLLAIRKNHARCEPPHKRGNEFEIVLIQVKGGSAAFPTFEDAKRLRMVARHYRAKNVLLAQWKRGKQVQFFVLRKNYHATMRRDIWIALESPLDVFR